jgi:hypothetical protein
MSMSTNVIAHLNELAARDGITVDDDLGLSAVVVEEPWIPEEHLVTPSSLTVYGRSDSVLPPALQSAVADAGVDLGNDGVGAQ